MRSIILVAIKIERIIVNKKRKIMPLCKFRGSLRWEKRLEFNPSALNVNNVLEDHLLLMVNNSDPLIKKQI
jgi:hypothetical protein